jgi:hypothetical protein
MIFRKKFIDSTVMGLVSCSLIPKEGVYENCSHVSVDNRFRGGGLQHG